MAKNTSNSSNTQNGVDIKTFTDEELDDKLKIAKETSNFGDMIIYAWEMKRRLTPEVDEFAATQKEMVKKIKEWKMTKKEMQKYFIENIMNFQSEVKDRLDSTDKYKTELIFKLQGQLTDVVTDLPGLSEQFSLKRRRLATLAKRITEFKKSWDYPKNLLIYCMSMTKTKVFGVREKMKRWWTTMLWKLKNDDMKSLLQNLEDKLKPDSSDSKHKQLLKELLSTAVLEAKKAYVKWVWDAVWV